MSNTNSTSSLEDAGEYSLATIANLQNEYRKKGEFCDIILKCGDKEFPANKIILAIFSPFFKAMFSGNFPESAEATVPLTTVNADIMEIVLDYAYTTKIEITTRNVEPIFRAAHFFQVATLVNMCRQFLGNNINTENCLQAWGLAGVYCVPDLEKTARDYILKEFMKVCTEPDFLELEADKLVDILRDDFVDVEDERVVFDAVLRWFHFKEEERKEDLGKVFRHIRLAHMERRYLFVNTVETGKAHGQVRSIRRLMKELTEYSFLQPVGLPLLEMQFPFTRRRVNSPQVEVILLLGWNAGTKERTYLAEDGRLFETYPDEPFLDSYIVSFRNYKLIAFNDETCCLLTPEGNKWNEIAYPTGRSEPRFGEADGVWYVIGGKLSDGTATNKVQRYDPSNNEWADVAPMSEAVWAPAITCMSGKLFVVGGHVDEETKSLHVQEYNTHANTWRTLKSLPGILYSVVCALNSHIYTFCLLQSGGSDELVLHEYNIESNEWRRCANTNHTTIDGSVVLNGRLFALSKKSNNEMVLECYNPANDSWTDCREIRNDGVPLQIAGPLLINCDQEITSCESGEPSTALPECSKAFREE